MNLVKICDYYETYQNQIVKIQSLVRKKYWFLYDLIKINKTKIQPICKRKTKEYVHETTIFGDDSKENIESLKTAFKQKQKKMKEGELAQTLIGNWIGWEDLGIGHTSGLDCRKKDNTIIMDVKNKWNTCNSGSKKDLFDKLSTYKKENPSTRCVWAIINPKPGCKKLSEKIMYAGVEIEKIQGIELFKIVFSIGNINYSPQIINIVKYFIRSY